MTLAKVEINPALYFDLENPPSLLDATQYIKNDLLPPVLEWSEGLIFQVRSPKGNKAWQVDSIFDDCVCIDHGLKTETIFRDKVEFYLASLAAKHYFNNHETIKNPDLKDNDPLYGFCENNKPLPRQRVLKTLAAIKKFRGVEMSRLDIIVTLHNEGWRVSGGFYDQNGRHYRKDGHFYSRHYLTKIGLAFAEYLENIGF